MLKRIGVEHLKTGMHLHELCGSWVDHPFWRTSFKLKNQSDIQSIVDSGITEVWIDTDKGLDVEAGETSEEAEVRAESELEQVVARDADVAGSASMSEELERAAKICATSRQAIVEMFGEARMGKAVDAGSALPLVEEIASSVLRNPGALISLARLKTADNYTYMHSVAVCALMIALARQLGIADERRVRDVGLSGLLHDVGKMAIPIEVLNKPGRLTNEEFTQVKDHPVAGHRMLLAGHGATEIALDVCLHHHEKVDGTGYPDRLAGDGISLFAKMGAVCDVYDAVTSDRPYKKGWDPAESLSKMASWRGGHFDETVFQAFVKSVGIYPVGSLVRLHSGRIGVIMEQSGKSLLTPKVKVFFSTRSDVRIAHEIVDLGAAGIEDRITSREDPAKWNFADLEELWRGPGARTW